MHEVFQERIGIGASRNYISDFPFYIMHLFYVLIVFSDEIEIYYSKFFWIKDNCWQILAISIF